MPAGSTSEDVLFHNQGSFVLSRMGVEHDDLRSQLLSHAVRFSSDWYHRLDVNKPETYRKAGAACFDKLNTALIWSFFLEANDVQKEIAGATADDVRRLCEQEVDMRGDHTAEELRELDDFTTQCYFVTHKVFTYTEWCRRRLRPEVGIVHPTLV